jgi:hypothetical protein
MEHRLILTIEHPSGRTIPIGGLSLEDVDPTDPLVPDELADALRFVLRGFYDQQRAELDDA